MVGLAIFVLDELIAVCVRFGAIMLEYGLFSIVHGLMS